MGFARQKFVEDMNEACTVHGFGPGEPRQRFEAHRQVDQISEGFPQAKLQDLEFVEFKALLDGDAALLGGELIGFENRFVVPVGDVLQVFILGNEKAAVLLHPGEGLGSRIRYQIVKVNEIRWQGARKGDGFPGSRQGFPLMAQNEVDRTLQTGLLGPLYGVAHLIQCDLFANVIQYLLVGGLQAE